MSNSKRLMIVAATTIIAALMLGACAPAATPTPVPTAAPTEVPLGSAERPIKVFFVPSVEVATIVSGGEILAKALKDATGLEFKVVVPNSYPATIEEMCADPNDSMAFMPPLGYVLANNLCGVKVGAKAERYGSLTYNSQFIVGRDSGINKIEDLAGKKWGFGESGSVSGYIWPLGMLESMGIKVGEKVQTGGHPQSVKAVYNGEVDFATTFFTAPGKPEAEPKWKAGDAPDIPEDLVETCTLTADKKNIVCSGWEVRDARTTIREEAPDVIQKVKILTLSTDIPNDNVSFGPDFPQELMDKIVAALLAFSKTDGWKESIGLKNFYNWTGLAPAKDADYDPVRAGVKAAGITIDILVKK